MSRHPILYRLYRHFHFERRSSSAAGCPPSRSGPADLAARLTGNAVLAAERRGKYLWLVLEPRRPPAGPDAPPGHERSAAGRPAGRAGGEAPARPVRVRGRRARAAVRRPADVRRRGRSRSRRRGRPWGRIAHIAPDPFEAGLRPGRRRGADQGTRHRGQAGAAGPVAGLGHRQHLRRRGVWRARMHGERPRPRLTSPRWAAARPRPRGDGGRPRAGRDELRRSLRQRQRGLRLLRPVAARLRAGGPAVRPLRDADPARGVHEPLVLLLPALPAAIRGLPHG